MIIANWKVIRQSPDGKQVKISRGMPYSEAYEKYEAARKKYPAETVTFIQVLHENGCLAPDRRKPGFGRRSTDRAIIPTADEIVITDRLHS